MDLIALALALKLQPLPDQLPKVWMERGIASTFHTPGDKHSGKPACLYGKTPNDLPDDHHFVAHRTLPCGTVVLVHNPANGKSAWAVTLDRGPYGAMYEGRWVLKRRSSDPGVWRGVVDLSPGVAKAIGSKGWTSVQIWRKPTVGKP